MMLKLKYRVRKTTFVLSVNGEQPSEHASRSLLFKPIWKHGYEPIKTLNTHNINALMTCLLLMGHLLCFVFCTELNIWCDLYFSALHSFMWGANCFIKWATHFIFVRTALPILHNNDNIVPYEAHCTLLLCLTVWTTSRIVVLLKHAVAHFSGQRAPQRTLAWYSL